MNHPPRRWLATKRRQKIAFAISMIIALPVIYLISQETKSPATPSTGNSTLIGFEQVSKPAPTFDLPLLQSPGRVTLGKLSGKPIVINFWATSCTVCIRESPAIADVARHFQHKVNFLGIDTLDSRNPAAAFIKHYGISYQVAYDPEGSAAARYGVPGLPVTFFLADSGKRILGVNVGALTAHGLVVILHQIYGVS